MSLCNNSSEPRRRHFRHYDGEQHEAACHLAGDSGASLKVFMAVVHRARVTRSKKATLTGDLCRQFAVDRKAKRRGLTLWQALGVFIIEQHVGKNPIVHISALPGRVVRRGRLRRVQVSHLGGEPAASLVEFNDGTEARVGREPDRARLVRLEASAGWIDVELVDRGTGWIVERFLPASAEWRPLEVVAVS
jgi:hypothetical protein